MATQLSPVIDKKPSFFASTLSGVGGYIKGAITAGIAGGLGGALIGAVVGGVGLALAGASGGLLPALAAVGAASLSGAGIGASIMAPLGALAGLITGVVKSRETHQPSANDIVNVAKISFAQGVQVGAHMEQAQGHGKGKFQEAYVKEKTVLAEQQIQH